MQTRAVTFLGLVLLLTACGGGPAGSPNLALKNGGPLDPQGNWKFTLTNTTTNNTFTWAGALFEVSPPTVTSTGGTATSFAGNCFLCVVMQINGTVSGTNSITLDAQQVGVVAGQGSPVPQHFTLTGTIADDQQHMSGTWSQPAGVTIPALGIAGGPWSAQLLGPVTGTYTGTLTEVNRFGNPIASPATIAVSAALTEDTSQTDSQMGLVSGTINLTGGCTASVNLPGGPSAALASHEGFVFVFGSTADPGNGTTLFLNSVGALSDDGKTLTLQAPALLQLTAGPCSGQYFAGTLTRP